MPPNRSPEIKWTVPLEYANYILAMLGDRPLKEAQPIDTLLRQQADGQLKNLQTMIAEEKEDQGEIFTPRRARANGGATATD